MKDLGGLIGALMAVAALTAAPAHAQIAPADPIDALLKQKAVEDEPDVAASGSTAVEPDPVVPATAPAAPRSILTTPTFLHETGKAPDGPGTAADQAYDDRLRASASAMRRAYGPLEGGWTLSAAGRAVFQLQLVDRDGYVEGAWRDLRRPGALDGSGFIEDTPKTGGDVTLRFAGDAVLVLHPESGRWAGQLTEAGRSEAATLVRRGP